jgi:hypothetical protein
MSKTISIVSLLQWAYQDELPKDGTTSFLRPEGFGFGWGAVSKAGKYLADVQEPDIRNRWGLVPDTSATRDASSDAVNVYFAVQDLLDLVVTVPEDWYPLADLGLEGHYGPAAVDRAIEKLCAHIEPSGGPEVRQVGKRRWRVIKTPDGGLILRRPLPETVQKYAILGGEPEWQAEPPEFKTITHEDGQTRWFRRGTVLTELGSFETEVDGMNHKTHRPYDDAYLKHYYDPDPADVAEARAEYEIWHAALSWLVDDLRGRLEEHELQPFLLPSRPWEEGEGDTPPPKILLDRHRPKPIVRTQRPLAGPPPKRGIERTKSEPKGQAA